MVLSRELFLLGEKKWHAKKAVKRNKTSGGYAFLAAHLFERQKMIIETKEGNRTKIKIVPDDYEEEKGFNQKDLTTSERKSIGFSDIDSDKWNKIFKKGE